jgi:hypothetical protein
MAILTTSTYVDTVIVLGHPHLVREALLRWVAVVSTDNTHLIKSRHGILFFAVICMIPQAQRVRHQQSDLHAQKMSPLQASDWAPNAPEHVI